jgi:hypothetical protein
LLVIIGNDTAIGEEFSIFQKSQRSHMTQQLHIPKYMPRKSENMST